MLCIQEASVYFLARHSAPCTARSKPKYWVRSSPWASSGFCLSKKYSLDTEPGNSIKSLSSGNICVSGPGDPAPTFKLIGKLFEPNWERMRRKQCWEGRGICHNRALNWKNKVNRECRWCNTLCHNLINLLYIFFSVLIYEVMKKMNEWLDEQSSEWNKKQVSEWGEEISKVQSSTTRCV